MNILLYIRRKMNMSRGESDELKQIKAKKFISYFQKFFSVFDFCEFV